MFLSMNWISDFVDLTGLDKVDLIHRFSLSTAEVENEIFFKVSDLSGIVVAEIKSVENHPKSEKLHLLKVDIGESDLVDCVRRSQCARWYENRLCKGWRKDRRYRDLSPSPCRVYVQRYVLFRKGNRYKRR